MSRFKPEKKGTPGQRYFVDFSLFLILVICFDSILNVAVATERSPYPYFDPQALHYIFLLSSSRVALVDTWHSTRVS